MPDGQPQEQPIQDPSTKGVGIDELAGRIKKIYPKLAQFDNTELVSKMVKQKPKLQGLLSPEATSQIVYHGQMGQDQTKDFGFTAGNMWDAGTGVVKGVGHMLKLVFDPTLPVTGKNGLIDQLLIQPQRKMFDQANALRKQGRMVEAQGYEMAGDLPFIGPMAAEFGERLGRKDLGGALTEALLYYSGGKAAEQIPKAGPWALKQLGESAARAMRTPGVISKVQRMAIEDAYVDAAGHQLRDKVGAAVSKAQEQVNDHAGAISTVVDARNPAGVIDAAKEANEIQQIKNRLVSPNTPIGNTPWLQKLINSTSSIPKGTLWSWETARQFRSAVGEALWSSDGVESNGLAQTYKGLTDKLKDSAVKNGMEDSWNQYNELSMKMHKYSGKFLNKVSDLTQSGHQVLDAFRQSGMGAEMLRNLKKYGLNAEDVSSLMRESSKILEKRTGPKSVYGMVYRSIPTFSIMALARGVLGLPFMESAGLGVALGSMSNYLMTLWRAAKLDPEMIRLLQEERDWPGAEPVRISTSGPQTAPAALPLAPAASPAAPSPAALPPAPAPATAPTEPIKTVEQAKELIKQKTEAAQKLVESAKTLDLSKAEDRAEIARQAKDLVKKSKPATKYSKLSDEAKAKARAGAKDRQEKARELGRRLRVQETQEALAGSGGKIGKTEEPQGRRASSGVQLPIDIPELEETVAERYGNKILKAAQELRKTKGVSDEDYVQKLRSLILMHMDKNGE